MKILVVLPRFPYPLEKGDKLRAYHQIKGLSQHNQIYLFCLSHSPVLPEQTDALRPFCQDIQIAYLPRLASYWGVVRNFLYSRPLQLGYWYSRRAYKAYVDFERRVQPDVIYCQMVRTMPYVIGKVEAESTERNPSPKRVLDFQDSLSMNTLRRMDQSRGLWRRTLHYEFKRLHSAEYEAFSRFDALTIISDTDRQALPHRLYKQVHVVPNGVDFDYFNLSQLNPNRNSSASTSIVFCGNMSYEPNVRASRYLAQQVMPLVWQQLPQATLLLAGATPRPSVTALTCDRIRVSGYVEDIRSCYASAKVFAAPMLTGSGLQNKLLEAMAMQLPCVTTSLANASLQATPDLEVLIGDSPQQFADHLVHLLTDEDYRLRMAQAGHQYALAHFSWNQSCQQLESILRSTIK